MEILDGVKLGERIALTDVDNLADGMKVTTMQADASQPARGEPAGGGKSANGAAE
jgi:hypothetical protein